MAKGFFYKDNRNGQVFVPDGDEGMELITKLGQGEIVEIAVRKARSPTAHRFYWKLCSFVAKSGAMETSQHVSDVIKLGTGHCDVVEVNGVVYKIPKSIAFENLDDIDFRQYLDRATEFVKETWLPHMTIPEIVNEVERMLIGARP